AALIFFFLAEDGIRDGHVTGVQTCALPIFNRSLTLKPARAPSDSILAKRFSREFPRTRRRERQARSGMERDFRGSENSQTVFFLHESDGFQTVPVPFFAKRYGGIRGGE